MKMPSQCFSAIPHVGDIIMICQFIHSRMKGKQKRNKHMEPIAEQNSEERNYEHTKGFNNLKQLLLTKKRT